MLDAYNLRQQLNETEVIDSWAAIMGKTVASRTTKLFCKDKKLFVKLSSAPLKHELSLSKDKIIKLFSARVGAGIVEDIVFL
jgi:predicted nucleic acid-binding Zn ribbon protein